MRWERFVTIRVMIAVVRFVGDQVKIAVVRRGQNAS
jgi:hypothetical protein